MLDVLNASQSYPVATYLVASIAAVSAWVAIYELRHSDGPRPPDVRIDFEVNDDGEPVDFGLRNYGAGPALYIQFVAQVKDTNHVCLGPLDRPIHLCEGEFVGMINDGRVDQPREGGLFEFITDEDLSGHPEESSVEVYCAYVSVEGVRGPRKLDVPDDNPEKAMLDEIMDYHPMPQEMPIKEIRDELGLSDS